MQSEEHIISSIRKSCGELSTYATVLNNASQECMEYKEAFKSSAMSMIRLKALSRNLHVILEEKRKTVDSGKLRVDNQQLKLENLLYKQAYLEREIDTCKTISTPAIATLEKDMKTELTTSTYSDELWNFHDDMVASMKKEKLAREAMQGSLERKQGQLQQLGDVLEKKRKFLEVDFPARVHAIRTIAMTAKTSLDDMQVPDPVSISRTNT